MFHGVSWPGTRDFTCRLRRLRATDFLRPARSPLAVGLPAVGFPAFLPFSAGETGDFALVLCDMGRESTALGFACASMLWPDRLRNAPTALRQVSRHCHL